MKILELEIEHQRVHIVNLCCWPNHEYRHLFIKNGFRLYIFLRLLLRNSDNPTLTPTTLSYLKTNIL